MKPAKFVLLGMLAGLSTSGVFAGETTKVPLEASEIESVLALFDRLEVASISLNADCSESQAIITSEVKGFNPAKWSAEYSDDYAPELVSELEENEIPAMLALFDRVGVPSVRVNSITSKSTAVVKSKQCNLRPAKWTIEFASAE